MRIFKVKRQGVLYKVFEALQETTGLIIGWKLVGSTLYEWNAASYIRQNGRLYDPTIDRVLVVWQDGIGTYMKRY